MSICGAYTRNGTPECWARLKLQAWGAESSSRDRRLGGKTQGHRAWKRNTTPWQVSDKTLGHSLNSGWSGPPLLKGSWWKLLPTTVRGSGSPEVGRQLPQSQPRRQGPTVARAGPSDTQRPDGGSGNTPWDENKRRKLRQALSEQKRRPLWANRKSTDVSGVQAWGDLAGGRGGGAQTGQDLAGHVKDLDLDFKGEANSIQKTRPAYQYCKGTGLGAFPTAVQGRGEIFSR